MIKCTATLLQGIYLDYLPRQMQNLSEFTTIEQMLKNDYSAIWIEAEGVLYMKFNTPKMESKYRLKYSEYL